MKAHDAGLKGSMTETLDSATFTIDELKSGQSVTIGGKGYTVGSTKKEMTDKFDADVKAENDTVTIDGKQYKVVANTGTTDLDKGEVKVADLAQLKALIKDTSTVEFADGTKMVGMGADADQDGVSDARFCNYSE